MHRVPMLLKRKEAKSYGTKKMVEGVFVNGDRCVIVEDVVTSGGSVLETAACLKSEGLVVTDVITILDRGQGGQKNLENQGITLHSVLSIRSVIAALLESAKITSEQAETSLNFIETNQLISNSVIDPIEDIVLRLHDIGSFRFGSFKLSNGMITPIYIDLRLVISHPSLMSDICKQMYKLVEGVVQFDILCGVPYAALHLATCIANDHGLNNVLLRKVVKQYGTGKLIEGVYKEGQKCLVVEDVMVSGQGIYESCEGVEATDVLLVLDREQNGERNLKKQGIRLHCLIRVSEALDILLKHKRIDAELSNEVMRFLKANPANIPFTKAEDHQRTSQINKLLPFDERAALCSNPVSKKLFTIMHKKHTNLCLSADVTTVDMLLKLADQVGPHICMLKTHVDILEDFTTSAVTQLVELSQKHNFVIFEDRKFSDIGSTVKQQYAGGLYKIADWSEVTTAHSIPGPGIVQALQAVTTVNMAREYSDFVIGFISQSKLTSDPTLLHMTPGVKNTDKGDNLGQQYVNAADAVTLRGADIIIVGRGITQAADPVAAANEYKNLGYESYENLRTQQKSDE
ncbi:UMPS [Bugula neritina]|uniref:orotidine-5'-phosphate decarboxylase n=1 Tax=Bugula neritina TaxID=10212 RepID=A0A7J7KBR1_BUGNE|nr:UMPS [Bugula neritina]